MDQPTWPGMYDNARLSYIISCSWTAGARRDLHFGLLATTIIAFRFLCVISEPSCLRIIPADPKAETRIFCIFGDNAELIDKCRSLLNGNPLKVSTPPSPFHPGFVLKNSRSSCA